ncbi:hypothetical protein ACHAXS_010671 [Conticribra weissflogii]
MEQLQRNHPSLTQQPQPQQPQAQALPSSSSSGVILRLTNAERRQRCLDDIRRRRRLLRRKPGIAIVTPSRSTPPPPSQCYHRTSESTTCRPSSSSSSSLSSSHPLASVVTPRNEKVTARQKEEEQEQETNNRQEITIRRNPHLRSFLVENFLPDRDSIALDSRRRRPNNDRHRPNDIVRHPHDGDHNHNNNHNHNHNNNNNHNSSDTRAKYKILRHAIHSVSPLIRKGMDRPGGIQLSVDNPWKSRHFVVNVERPAVLRQYFGRTVERHRKKKKKKNGKRKRKRDGERDGDGDEEAHVEGRDDGGEFVTRHFVTREMTPSMTIVADEIHHYLKELLRSDKSLSIEPFNHVTVLLYYEKTPRHGRVDDEQTASSSSSSSSPSTKTLLTTTSSTASSLRTTTSTTTSTSTLTTNSSPRKRTQYHRKNHLQLPYHTDNVYSKSGKFLHAKNSQKQYTVTAILTLGDERILHFQKQCLYKNHSTGIGIWRKCHEGESFERFRMGNGSLFVLHPEDEVPMFRKRRGSGSGVVGGVGAVGSGSGGGGNYNDDASSSLWEGARSRFLHGGIRNRDTRMAGRFRDRGHDRKLSVALVFRTVTAKLTLHRVTGKFPDSPKGEDGIHGNGCDDDDDDDDDVHDDDDDDSTDSTIPSSSTTSSSSVNNANPIDEKLATFRRERLKRANSKLQLLWCSVCMRYFGSLLDFRGKDSSRYSLRHPRVLALGEDD